MGLILTVEEYDLTSRIVRGRRAVHFWSVQSGHSVAHEHQIGTF
jgi:hypothetical protein